MPDSPPTCPCGHDRTSHWARPSLKFGLGAWLLLFNGASGRPKEITFRCGRCGGVIETTRAPEVLEAFRGADR